MHYIACLSFSKLATERHEALPLTSGESMSDRDSLHQHVIFSLMDGFVWASWPGTDVVVRLGGHDAVSVMMQDFLAQNAVAARLENRVAVRK